MSKIAYVESPLGTVHASVSTEKYLGADLHERTLCGVKITPTFHEVATPDSISSRRCGRCDYKRIDGIPAFDAKAEMEA